MLVQEVEEDLNKIKRISLLDCNTGNHSDSPMIISLTGGSLNSMPPKTNAAQLTRVLLFSTVSGILMTAVITALLKVMPR